MQIPRSARLLCPPIFLAILLFSGLAHATGIDLSYSFAAIMIGVGVIAVGFMATYAFGMPHIRAMLQDELVQVLASGAVLLMIVSINVGLDGYIVSAVKAADQSGSYSGIDSVMDAANATLQQNIANISFIYDDARGKSTDIGKQGSKNIYCVFLGVGFSINNCGQLNAFRGSLTTLAMVASTALADLFAQQALLSLAKNISFAFLIPLGLFLRTFKASRRAGGALIAIGFGFYTVFPLATIATHRLLHGSTMSNIAQLPPVGECDPYETDNGKARAFVQSYASQLSDLGLVENIIYNILVRVIFSSIFNLMVTLAFIRTVAHIIGSDIDVSSLARIS